MGGTKRTTVTSKTRTSIRRTWRWRCLSGCGYELGGEERRKHEEFCGQMRFSNFTLWANTVVVANATTSSRQHCSFCHALLETAQLKTTDGVAVTAQDECPWDLPRSERILWDLGEDQAQCPHRICLSRIGIPRNPPGPGRIHPISEDAIYSSMHRIP